LPCTACVHTLSPIHAEPFAQITSKSSAFLGPLLVGILSQKTGSLRSGFIAILIGCLGPLPLLMSIDMERGRRDAKAFAAAGSVPIEARLEST
jgi:hypothetical protein